MDTIVPKNIKSTISEYTYNGYLYLYEEQPENMRDLENYLETQSIYIDIAYRRTDYHPFLNAKAGDILKLTRVSSWSRNNVVPNEMYEGTTSVMLILENTYVRGLDVTPISFFKNEEEILLAPCEIYVSSITDDVLTIKYISR